MEVTFASAKEFQKCISAISALIDEGEFFFSDEGMKLRAMDPSQIAMVDFLYPREAFESFKAEDEERLGVNFADLESIVKRAKADEKLTIRAEEGRLSLIFKGKTTRKFSIALIDLGGTFPKEPKIPFDATVKLYGGFLKDSLKDASVVASHVVFKATKDAFYIEARGDKGEVSIVAEKGQDIVAGLDVSSEARSMFPLGYLVDLVSPVEASSIVELKLKTDAPLKISYKIGEANLNYYVAPRIESV